MSEIVIKCPVCGDHPNRGHHYHCHVNVQKGVFYCFLNDCKGTVKWLLRRYPEVKTLLDLDGIGIETKFPMSSYESFASFTESVINEGRMFAQIRQYLTMRGLTSNEIVKYKVMASFGMPHRAIFPINSPREFWAARSTVGASPPWLFPKHGATFMDKSTAIWKSDGLVNKPELWVTEGIFDAIAVKGVALFGKKPSNYQLQKIFRLNPKRLVIAFDRDALEEARSLQKTMRVFVPTRIELPPEGFSDFGETLPVRGAD